MVVVFGEHGLTVISPLQEELLSRFIFSIGIFCVWCHKENITDTSVTFDIGLLFFPFRLIPSYRP